MNHELRLQRISDIAKILQQMRIGLDQETKNADEWRLLWVAASGACYSLYCAERHVEKAFLQRETRKDIEEDIRKKVEEAALMLNDLIKAEEPGLNHKDTWLLSYYTKGVEFRICNILERCQRLRLGLSKGDIYKLIKNTLKLVRQSSPTDPLQGARSPLEEGFEKYSLPQKDSDILKEKDLCPGKALRRVWWRIREFKHKGRHVVDEGDPQQRFLDALEGLYCACQIFYALAPRNPRGSQ